MRGMFQFDDMMPERDLAKAWIEQINATRQTLREQVRRQEVGGGDGAAPSRLAIVREANR